MKVKRSLAAFAVLSFISILFLATSVLTGQINIHKKTKKTKPVKVQFPKRLFSARIDGEKYWVQLPREISSEYPTPIVFLMHGGVFKNVDYGYIFLNIFRSLIKDFNIIFVVPSMPRSSWPIWQKKDYQWIKKILRKTKKDFRLHPQSKIFFGGFSNGAEHALKLSLTGEIKPDGVFAFAGGCRLFLKNPVINMDRNIPIFLSSGYNDGNWFGSSVSSYHYLKKNHFTNLKLLGVPHLEHWISSEQALQFIEWIYSHSE